MAGFFAGDAAWAPFAALLLLPSPWPDGLEAIRLELDSSVFCPMVAHESELRVAPSELAKTLLFWGSYDVLDGFFVAAGSAPPPIGQGDRIAKVKACLERLLGPCPFARVACVVLPVGGQVGRRGFCGAGLAARAAVILFLPADYQQMNPTCLLWLAAHELAHLWIGVTLRAASPGLEWLFEGFPCYYALLAVCQCGYADEAYFRDMVRGSLARRNLSVSETWDTASRAAMHEGFLAALALQTHLLDAGSCTLEDVVRALQLDKDGRGRFIRDDTVEATFSAVAGSALDCVFENPRARPPRLQRRWVEKLQQLAGESAGTSRLPKALQDTFFP